MFRIPNILVIGSAGRNSGKTEFACELIRKYRSLERVIGVKITTIDEDRPCPRGGDSCGVCEFFTGKYSITEERDGPSACIICESNSSRQVLEPGFFIVMKEKNSRVIKKTCSDVLKYADKVVTFHGSGWDMSPEDVTFAKGKWSF